jgi:superfamily II DNA or RNA helicase
MVQSLKNKEGVKDLVAEYGHVIVDECHHVAAFTVEAILKQVKAKYVLGLTATPTRKDGHHPIIIMQCGPIRYRVNPKQQVCFRTLFWTEKVTYG